MTIINGIDIKSENLLQQLEGWKFIATTNRGIFDVDPFLQEFLAFKLDLAQSFIEELQFWEKVENQMKCLSAIENTQFFVGQIQVIIVRTLDNQCEEAKLGFQNELRFTKYVSIPHELVLKRTREQLALAA